MKLKNQYQKPTMREDVFSSEMMLESETNIDGTGILDEAEENIILE